MTSLIMFFEGIRSERQLVRAAADRLSLCWYLGYDLHEDLPDHSSLTRNRDRCGVDTFPRFFERIVEQCQTAGLVWGKQLHFDSTQVEANADYDTMLPRFYKVNIESLLIASGQNLKRLLAEWGWVRRLGPNGAQLVRGSTSFVLLISLFSSIARLEIELCKKQTDMLLAA